jgi:hypothetical protein
MSQFSSFEAAAAANAPVGVSQAFELTTGGESSPNAGSLDRLTSFKVSG